MTSLVVSEWTWKKTEQKRPYRRESDGKLYTDGSWEIEEGSLWSVFPINCLRFLTMRIKILSTTDFHKSLTSYFSSSYKQISNQFQIDHPFLHN